MKLSELYFDLPENLIAQHPVTNRDKSRMLILDKTSGEFSDSLFDKFPRYLDKGDVLVLNNTRVFPARLIGTRKGFSGQVEIFLIRRISSNCWEALVKPGRRIHQNTRLSFGDGVLEAEVVSDSGRGKRIIQFDITGEIFPILNQIGQTPLPPYIQRDTSRPSRFDQEKYQTVYASQLGAVAAPTAGLHFTQDILDRLSSSGIKIVELTLHVGYGTFQPVLTENIEDHQIEPEEYIIPVDTAEQINLAKREGRRVIAVGTTSTRALESAAQLVESQYGVPSGKGYAELLITPGYKFRIVDGLLTNFHLPSSSLLALICAFGKYNQVMLAYKHAINENYRFYSYGDCMLIV